MLVLDTNTIAHGATTQYVGGPEINSFAKFNGRYLAASSSGLFVHEGSLDDTAIIPAYFITATMDFGINNDKRLRYVYLSLEATDDLELTINTEKVAGITYTVPIDKTKGQQDVRITISHALHGRFWTFKLGNGTTGADFSVDEIKVRPIIRNGAH